MSAVFRDQKPKTPKLKKITGTKNFPGKNAEFPHFFFSATARTRPRGHEIFLQASKLDTGSATGSDEKTVGTLELGLWI